tara:strand:- start:2065 stop:2628 length:564 start_codon:yes stop_codon:yes gene_type:complete
MNYKKIIIYQYDSLFNILSEISEILNFDIIKADKDNFEELKKNLKNDFLIISKNKDDDFENQFQINKLPIKIDKLIEQINLKFLKITFHSQSDMPIGPYRLNINSRKISKNKKIIDLTEREMNLILFLKKSSLPVKIDKLQKEVWGYSSELETHTVETHIYRLRKKIKEEFADENFIISEKKGYSIN